MDSSKAISKHMENARKVREAWTDIIRKHCEAGMMMGEMRKATGKSHAFIRRIMDENGFKLASEAKPEPAPVKKPDPSKLVIEVSTGTCQRANRISLRRPPWGEFARDPRHETAPRGNSHMYSSPVTRAEQIERALWQEAGV
ncbi:hypothetical protein Q0601_00820 [Paracoccus onubensis]|uniref:hypothetical protein n=1 Tax=Paracoccus onubensis TaxID=1675788 RepID=UPI002730154F|nr:hypothetical protein [Paracoccus onubensis]MDP0925704.1 hypothetical protein [Paracoccus onubensis]